MRVLITGGYGCIGSWIARVLLERKADIWIYDLKEELRRLRMVLAPDQLKQINHLSGDVTDLSGLKTVLEKHAITHIVHLAGLQVPICRADPLLGAKVNVLGTLAVFEATRQCMPQIQRVVYASSAAVFGPAAKDQQGRLADNDNLVPATHYGVFKCCNEGNARIYFQDHGLSSIGLRPWTVFGVGRDFGMTSEPTKAIKSMVLGRPYHISYGGFQDLQYVEDVAEIFVRCLEVPFQGARAFNLRGHVIDLQTFHQALMQVDSESARKVTFGENQLSIAYDLDDSGLQSTLGGFSQTPLLEAVRRTYQHFQRLADENRLDTYDLDN